MAEIVVDKRLNYPVFVISYNRPNNQAKTITSFIKYGLSFNLCVHKNQIEDYKNFFNSDLINYVEFDYNYKHSYEVLSNLDSYQKNSGPGAERNFCWDLAKNKGYSSYWVFDDNMCFYYFTGKSTQSKKSYKRNVIKDKDEFIKKMIESENFYNKYDNLFIIEIAEGQYFCTRNKPALNRRCYSALLINTAIPTQWRGRYNEDTILSLDILVNGFCTAQIPFLLKYKGSTRKSKGGNHSKIKGEDTDVKNQMYTDGVDYENSSRLKSELLVAVYPKFCFLKYKNGRIHHGYTQNWKLFKQKLHIAKSIGHKIPILNWKVSKNIYDEVNRMENNK